MLAQLEDLFPKFETTVAHLHLLGFVYLAIFVVTCVRAYRLAYVIVLAMLDND